VRHVSAMHSDELISLPASVVYKTFDPLTLMFTVFSAYSCTLHEIKSDQERTWYE